MLRRSGIANLDAKQATNQANAWLRQKGFWRRQGSAFVCNSFCDDQRHSGTKQLVCAISNNAWLQRQVLRGQHRANLAKSITSPSIGV